MQKLQLAKLTDGQRKSHAPAGLVWTCRHQLQKTTTENHALSWVFSRIFNEEELTP
jgi:hypothetical protein